MRILAIDIGTGTQDILLFDSDEPVENSAQLVMPAPTQIVARKVRAATHARAPIALTGTIMGGGPCHWAVEDHLRAGLAVYATPAAATTFNDDLEWVRREMGVRLVSDDEIAGLSDEVQHVIMSDLDLGAIDAALAAFGVVGADSARAYDAVAAAVFDHGNAPPEISDRVFRFNYLGERFATGRGLLALGFRRDQVPLEMTRLRAVADAAPDDMPVLLMDTAPAAVLGALDDPRVAEQDDLLVANVGNFHCLAFHLTGGTIAGCFEHHTGELQVPQLESFLRKLADGTITNREVYESMGHGALVLRASPDAQAFLAVTGPRRAMLRGSDLQPYFAVPHGDMMLAGCFGLLRAYAANYPKAAEAIQAALQSS
ncbi:MAG TPA: DUF1786 family protein [Roseiflexaceae bacterium]|nr:DUF1786 family protein [Roseiflexaceae bacterium]